MKLLLTFLAAASAHFAYSQSPQTKGDFTYWDYNQPTTYVLKERHERTPEMISGKHYVTQWQLKSNDYKTTSKFIISDDRIQVIMHTTKIVDRYTYRRAPDTIRYNIPVKVFSKEDTQSFYNVKYSTEDGGKIEFKYNKTSPNNEGLLIIYLEDKDILFTGWDKSRYEREKIAKEQKIREERKKGWN